MTGLRELQFAQIQKRKAYKFKPGYFNKMSKINLPNILNFFFFINRHLASYSSRRRAVLPVYVLLINSRMRLDYL